METQEVEKVQRELIDLLLLIQQLSPTQLRALCQFVQVNQGQDCPYLHQILPLLQNANMDQIRRFIALVTKQIEPDQFEQTHREFEEIGARCSIPPHETETNFALLVGLYQLQGLLRSLTILQLMKLCEIIMIPGEFTASPNEHQGLHMQQLQLLQQIQQIFTQLDTQVLQRFHQQLEDALPGTEHQILMQLLNLPAEYFQLYQPLRLLLQLDLDELLRIKEVFAQILPVQMIMLLQLLQQQPFDILELRNILNLDDGMQLNDATYEPNISSMPMDPNGAPRVNKQIGLQITEQPPERSVYKRNLKPNPAVLLVGDQQLNDGSLYVSVSLIRCDTLAEEAKFITGNRPIRVTSGRIVTFKKIKILTTSHQQQETLFCLRFELRKYTGEDIYDVLDTVHSNPLTVMSHSTQMKPIPATAPTITEVIPNFGPVTGGTRIAILGTNFVENPAARIRFDSSDVMPIFHGPGTLICHTPQHAPGTVHVKVCNAAKKWSETVATFTFLELDAFEAANSQSNPISNDSNFQASNLTEAAWQGNYDSVKRIQETSRGNVDASDGRSFNALQYAASQGFVEIVAYLLDEGADAEFEDKEGNTALHWAVLNRQDEVIRTLIEHGADPNCTNFNGETPLSYAALTGQKEAVLFLLENGANANIANVEGFAPLHQAAATNQLEIAQILAGFGGFVNLVDDDNETPLFLAVREGNCALASLLVKMGANVNVSNDDGETPLILACSVGDSQMAEALLRHGAVLSSQDFKEIAVSRSDIAAMLMGGTSSELIPNKNVSGCSETPNSVPNSIFNAPCSKGEELRGFSLTSSRPMILA